MIVCPHCECREGTIETLVPGVRICDLCDRARRRPENAPLCPECENTGTVECDECDGDGTVTCEYEHTHDCPKCSENDAPAGHVVCSACKGASVDWPRLAPSAPPMLFAEAG